eukprot:jgi/Mesvir1/18988/Mv18949-RA.1
MAARRSIIPFVGRWREVANISRPYSTWNFIGASEGCSQFTVGLIEQQQRICQGSQCFGTTRDTCPAGLRAFATSAAKDGKAKDGDRASKPGATSIGPSPTINPKAAADKPAPIKAASQPKGANAAGGGAGANTKPSASGKPPGTPKPGQGDTQVPAISLGEIPLPRFARNVETTAAVRTPVSLATAIKAIKTQKPAKFNETVEVSIRLGIDPKRGDQMVRGGVTLPHATGKVVRVGVIVRDPAVAQQALAAGAAVAGGEDVINLIKEGKGAIPFDRCIASPDAMPLVSQVARILGPKGLMPNPKLGTVTMDVVAAVKESIKGRVQFRNDKTGVLNAGIGKVDLPERALAQNVAAFFGEVLAMRPKSLKGMGHVGYINAVHMCSTMGPSIKLDVADLVAAAKANA